MSVNPVTIRLSTGTLYSINLATFLWGEAYQTQKMAVVKLKFYDGTILRFSNTQMEKSEFDELLRRFFGISIEKLPMLEEKKAED
jgi:hypothetical protein